MQNKSAESLYCQLQVQVTASVVDGERYMAQAAEKPQMLNSWKEIASFLDRGVRTVQRWERELQLPVHRIGKGKRSPVYALVPELKFWIATSGLNSTPQKQAGDKALTLSLVKRNSDTPIQISHRLLSQSLELVRAVAEASVRQRRQAEILQKHLQEMKSRLK
jgi:hypothetical protein